MNAVVVVVVGLQLEVWMSLAKLDDYARNIVVCKHSARILDILASALVRRLICFPLSFDPAMGGDQDALRQVIICVQALLDMLKCALYFRKLPPLLKLIEPGLRTEYALGV
jgi:hypothetical protein